MSACKIIRKPENTVKNKKPHCKEVPLTCPGKPAAEGKCRRDPEVPNGRGIIDTKPAHDHDAERNEVQPVRQANDQWMLVFPMGNHVMILHPVCSPGTVC